LIKSNIDKPSILNKISNLYEPNKTEELRLENEKETLRIKTLIKTSIKYKDSNVKIRMLVEKDTKKALKLYIKFKIIMEEDIEDAESYIEDFILKNLAYGLFEKNKLVGLLIIDESKKFLIDDKKSKVDTFYIQEMIVDDKYIGKGYGNLLVNYAILKCPYNKLYISFMTKPTNIGMFKIAKRFNLIKQDLSSGDKNHSVLFIIVNDKIERSIYKNHHQNHNIYLSFNKLNIDIS